MKAAQTSIISFDRQGIILHLSIVQKQSQTGLMYNQRLLILNQGHFFGYLSKFNLKDNPRSVDLQKIKYSVPIKYIKAIDHDKENLIIKFLQIEDKKQQEKKWVFKMANAQMIQRWYRLLQEEKVKRANRSSERKSKSNRGSEQFSPKKEEKMADVKKTEQKQQSQQYINPYNNDKSKPTNSQSEQYLPTFNNTGNTSQNPPANKQTPPKNDKKGTSSPKHQPTHTIQQQDQQNQQFINPLYGYSSIQESEVSNRAKLKNTAKNKQSKIKQEPPALAKQQQRKKPQNLNLGYQIQQPKEQRTFLLPVANNKNNNNNINNRQNNLMKSDLRSPVSYEDNLSANNNIEENRPILTNQMYKNPTNNNKVNNLNISGNGNGNGNRNLTPTSQQDKSILAEKTNNNNAMFNKKPKSSYVDIVEKIVQESEKKALERIREKNREREEMNNQQENQDNSKILDQFLRYENEGENWKKQTTKTRFSNNNGQQQDLPANRRSSPNKNYQQLQQIQQYAIKIHRQKINKLISQNQTPRSKNINNFSKQIAQILRNRRFEKQGHDLINNQVYEFKKQKQQMEQKWNIKKMPFTYRYMVQLLLEEQGKENQNQNQKQNLLSAKQGNKQNQDKLQKQQDFMQLLHDWKIHCQDLMKELIQDIAVKENKRFKLKGKINNVSYYETQEVQIKLSLANLKNIAISAAGNKGNQKMEESGNEEGKKKQEKICDYSTGKDLEVQFKNYNTLFQLFYPLKQQANKKNSYSNTPTPIPKFQLPLVSLVQYYGFIGLFKLNPKFSQSSNNSSINQQLISKKQAQITKKTNIAVKWLENNSKNASQLETSSRFNNIGAGQTNQNNQPKKCLILHIDQSYYNQLHSQRKKQYLSKKNIISHLKQNNQTNGNRNRSVSPRGGPVYTTNKIFNFDFLQQIDGFLLKDYLTKSLNNGVLRMELIKEMIHKDQYKEIVFSNSVGQKNKSPVEQQKGQKKSKNEANLTLLSGQVLQKLSNFILKVDSLSFFYLCPEELSSFLHKQGINMRYIGLAYDNLTQPFGKKFLMTQISARVIKLLFRKTLQDIMVGQDKTNQKNQQPNIISSGRQSSKLQTPKSKSIRVNKLTGQFNLIDDIIDFMNCVLGSSYQSIAIWKVLQLHSLYYFKIKLLKEQIDPGYFIISLVHHCKLKVNWSKISNVIQNVFKREDFFNRDNLLGLEIRSKVYKPLISGVYCKLGPLLEGQNLHAGKQKSITLKQQSYHTVIKELNLQKSAFPAYLQIFPPSSPFSIISLKQVLAQYIRPQSVKISQEQTFSHLHIYNSNQLSQFPQRNSLKIKITELKWYLRMKKREKYLKKFQELSTMLNNFFGDYCPALSQVYDIFTNFHLQCGQYEDAITFAKSSLVNVLKISGTNHTKTGQSYYNLSLCYLKANKIQDAYGLIKKAKVIFQAKQRTSTQIYANILLQLGTLMLNKGEIKEAIKQIEQAIEIFNQLIEEIQFEQQQNPSLATKNDEFKYFYENQKVQCFETLYRCYLLLSAKQSKNNRKNSQDKKSLPNIKLFQDLSLKLSTTFLNKIKSPLNLQKMLRITLYSYINKINPQDSTLYIDLISNLLSLPTSTIQEISPKTYNRAYSAIRKRVDQNSLINNFQNYVQNFSSINDFIEMNGALTSWKSMSGVEYERETVNDFIALTQELICFVGESYLIGVLREVLERGE